MSCWDVGLVIRMKQGDAVAFERCYRVLSKSLYTSIINICRNEMVASELLQETFIDAFSNLSRYREAQSFPAWVKRIAINKTINYVKRAKKEELILKSLHSERTDNLNIELTHSDENLLEQLLANISLNERLIIWLFIVERYSHQEIGELVSKSPSYSKSIVSRTLKKLKIKSQELLNAK